MRIVLTVAILGLLAASVAQANESTESGIHLDCEQQGALLVQRIKQEQVVNLDDAQSSRIEQLTVELCLGTEQVATEQHKELEANAVKNWFMSDHLGGKKGNERLKRLK